MNNVMTKEKIYCLYGQIKSKISILEKELAQKLWGDPTNQDLYTILSQLTALRKISYQLSPYRAQPGKTFALPIKLSQALKVTEQFLKTEVIND